MKVIYSVILLFIAFPSFAQKDSSNRHKILLNINYGVSFPANIQSSTNYNDTWGPAPLTEYTYLNTIYGSTALHGTFLNGSIAIPIIHNRWSILVLAAYYVNDFEDMQGSSSSTNYMSGYDLMNLQGTRYKEYNLLVGMMKTFTKNRFNVDIWAALGYGKSYAPEITFEIKGQEYGYAASVYYYDIPAENGGGLAIDMGAGIRYRIIKNLFITLHIDGYHSGFTYASNWTVNPTPYIHSVHAVQIYEPPPNIAERMSLFNLSGGLAYQFGK